MGNSVYYSIIAAVGTVCAVLFLYQFVYVLISLVKKLPEYEAKRNCSYAVMIAARNEENVIGSLIKSIRAQDYPAELIKIFVVADNCADNTARAAREAGAIVYERFNGERKGKGYALEFLVNRIKSDYGLEAFDGYLVFDADNLLSPSYITEINKVFSNGCRICTSYRNSKNYGSNWISAASGLWFLRDARHLNHARTLLGVSCMVTGTGYVMHRDILIKNGGWKHFMITEDAEFSADCIINGEKIGYCEKAVFYDEQPTTLRASLTQRLRWCNGMYQVLSKNFPHIIRGLFSRRFMTYFDMLVTLSPGIIFLAAFLSSASLTVAEIFASPYGISEAVELIIPALLGSYLMFFVLGFLVIMTEHRKVYCDRNRMLALCFTFPLFMLTYMPLAVVALFAKVKWTPVRHTFAYGLAEMEALR